MDQEILGLVKESFGKIKGWRDRLAPEREAVVGALAAYFYSMMLFQPELLPERVQNMVELVRGNPIGIAELYALALIGVMGTADGARRVAVERLPYYKAYLDVFIFKRKRE